MQTQNRYNFILSGLLFLTTVVGNAQEEKKTFQLSLVYPVSTNGHQSKEIEYDYSLNLFAGYTGGVSALEIGGFYNVTGGHVNGVQVAGFGNTVIGDIDGVQLGGFSNTGKGNVKGTQIAGFSNVSSTNRGVQVAGFNNHNSRTEGVQIAGFINTSGDVKGSQVAGFVNVAKKVSGTQIGVINIADSIASGTQVGLINISKKNGFISLGLESDDVMPYRLVFRSGMDYFYTVLVAGIHPEDDYWSLGAGLGSRMFLTNQRKVFVNPEARWENISNGSIGNDDFSHLTKLNLNFGYHFQENFYIAAGPSVNYYVTDDLNENGLPSIELSDSQTINRLNNNTRHQLWIGYNLGLGFKF